MGGWGLGIFQSDYDYDLVRHLSQQAGLPKLEAEAGKQEAPSASTSSTRHSDHKKAKKGDDDLKFTSFPKDSRASAKGKEEKIYYSLYAPLCSDLDFVRQYLDRNGVISAMMARKQREIATDTDFGIGCCLGPAYQLVITAACAMTLGARLTDKEVATVQEYYPRVGLMRDAATQMETALANYKNGTPWDFGSLGLDDTMADEGLPKKEDFLFPGTGMSNCCAPDHDLPGDDVQDERAQLMKSALGLVGKIEISAKDLATTFANLGLKGAQKEAVPKKVINFPDGVCGGCGAKEDTKLQACGKCKQQLYCGSTCQRAHWGEHKKVCQAF